MQRLGNLGHAFHEVCSRGIGLHVFVHKGAPGRSRVRTTLLESRSWISSGQLPWLEQFGCDALESLAFVAFLITRLQIRARFVQASAIGTVITKPTRDAT